MHEAPAVRSTRHNHWCVPYLTCWILKIFAPSVEVIRISLSSASSSDNWRLSGLRFYLLLIAAFPRAVGVTGDANGIALPDFLLNGADMVFLKPLTKEMLAEVFDKEDEPGEMSVHPTRSGHASPNPPRLSVHQSPAASGGSNPGGGSERVTNNNFMIGGSHHMTADI